ncbi:MAG TPA: lipoprotein insertase outer membrane protein LolB [Burkholderiaceae bacterium]|nr:lipoprotein insertase outer membrane protein LolB [Burkholderiaceae bacterium]
MKRRGALAFGVGLLASCATTAPRAPSEIAGRLALRIEPPDAPARAFAADFDLRGDAERGQLRLAGPLGATLAEARWQPGRAELTRPDAAPEAFDTLDALALALLGEAVPLAALPDWLRGRPWTGARSVARSGGFDQLDWSIDLAQLADGVIVATRARTPKLAALTVRVRLDRGD